MEGMEILKDNNDLKFLILTMLMSLSVLIGSLLDGCSIEHPHPVYDSVYTIYGV